MELSLAQFLTVGPPPHKSEVAYRMSGDYMNGWKINWLPEELGVHNIDIKYGDKHIVGSPFRCRVYDLTKVRLYRDEMSERVDLDGIPGEDIVFFGKTLKPLQLLKLLFDPVPQWVLIS